MNLPKSGLLAALALAGGVAIGAAGSTIAASPSGSPAPSPDPWTQMTRMMGGAGMMGAPSSIGRGMMNGSHGHGMMGSFAPGTSFGPAMMNGAGMMGNLDSAGRDALLAQCDELHDAMHAAAAASPAPSGAPQPSGAPSLHDLHHPQP